MGKYYIILLLQGKVIDITNYDDQEVRDKYVAQYAQKLLETNNAPCVLFDITFDDVQKFDEIY